MATRKSTATVNLAANITANPTDLPALESAAITAVRSIESGYAVASKAILAYTLGAKEAGASPPMFNAGITRISDAIPGVAKITVGAYISNARRIFAAYKESLAKAVKTAGTDSIKALAGACPVVSRAKAEGQKARAEAKAETKTETKTAPSTPTATDAKAPSAPVVTTPSNDPMLAASNALVAMRKLATGKKKAKLILAAIGEVEDMLQDIADMMKAA